MMALHGMSPQLSRNSSQEGERVNGWFGCTGRDKDKEKIKINERVNGWLGAPEQIKKIKIKKR